VRYRSAKLVWVTFLTLFSIATATPAIAFTAGYFQNGSVSPTSGNTSTDFDYNVQLITDPAIDVIYSVQVRIDPGTPQETYETMQRVSAFDPEWYYIDNVNLPAGNHTFRFRAHLVDTDTNPQTWYEVLSSIQTGPNVDAPPAPKAQYQVIITNNDDSQLSTYFKTDKDSSYQGPYSVNANGGVYSSSYIEVSPGSYSVTIKWKYPEKSTEDTQTSSVQQINAGDIKKYYFTIPKYVPPATTTTTTTTTTTSTTTTSTTNSVPTTTTTSTTTTTIPSGASTINVTVKKQDGTTLVSGAEVKRYSSGFGSLLESKNTNSSGVASFTSVPDGTYDFEVYYDGEFWGNPSTQTVSGPNSYNVNFIRYMPYGESVNSDQSTLEVNEAVMVTVTVRNKASYPNNVKVRLLLDRDQAAPYAFDQWSSIQKIQGNSAWTFIFNYTPQSSGAFYHSIEIQSQVGANYVKTDSWPWSAAKLFTAGSVEIFIEHKSGQIFKEEDDTVIYQDELQDYTLVVQAPYPANVKITDDSLALFEIFHEAPLVKKGDLYEIRYQFKASDLVWGDTQPAGNNISIKVYPYDKLIGSFYSFNLRAFGRSRLVEELKFVNEALGALADYLEAQKEPVNIFEHKVQHSGYTVGAAPELINDGTYVVKVQLTSNLDASKKKILQIGKGSAKYEIVNGQYKTTYNAGKLGQLVPDQQLRFDLYQGKKAAVYPASEKISFKSGSQLKGFSTFSEADDGAKYLVRNVKVKGQLHSGMGNTIYSQAGTALNGLLFVLTVVESANLYAEGPQSTSKAAGNLAGFTAGTLAAGETAALIGTGGLAAGIASAGVGLIVGGTVAFIVGEALPHPSDIILSAEVEAGADAYLEFSLRNQGTQTHVYKLSFESSPECHVYADKCDGWPIIGSGCSALGNDRYSIDKGGYVNLKIKVITPTDPISNFPVKISIKEEETGLNWDVPALVRTYKYSGAGPSVSPEATCKFGAGTCDSVIMKNHGDDFSYSLSVAAPDKASPQYYAVKLYWPYLPYELEGRDFSNMTIEQTSRGIIDIKVPSEGDTQILANSSADITIYGAMVKYNCVVKHNGVTVYENGKILDESLITGVTWDENMYSLTLHVQHFDAYTIIVDPSLVSPGFSALSGPNPFSPNGDGVSDTNKISYQLTANAKIRIRLVSLSGRKIRSWNYEPGVPGKSSTGYNEVEWDGRDEAGNLVNNGLYLCYILVEAGGEVRKAKLQIAVLK
jgi:hypothetical protein